MEQIVTTWVVRFSNLVKIALGNVFSWRLQNILTVTTMSVGAFTLSATLSLGDGALHSLWRDLEMMMGSWMIVHPQPENSTLASRLKTTPFFTLTELEALRQSVTTAKYIEPFYSARELLTYREIRIRISVDGIGAPLFAEEIYTPLFGKEISQEARAGFAWEGYLTRSLHMSLGAPPLEDFFVKVGRSRFQIVGVTPDPPEADAAFSRRLIIPFSLAENLWGKNMKYGNLVVGWSSLKVSDETMKKVREVLDKERGVESYFLSSSLFTLQKRKEIVKSFVIFGSIQALFSILVASVGILNVMLANVVHKMREFAIRITLGASQGDIFTLVITESICYGLFGSALGVICSIIFSPSLCSLVSRYLQGAENLVPINSWHAIVLPLIICSICGLAAGIAPALRAVRIDILTILRAE